MMQIDVFGLLLLYLVNLRMPTNLFFPALFFSFSLEQFQRPQKRALGEEIQQTTLINVGLLIWINTLCLIARAISFKLSRFPFSR